MLDALALCEVQEEGGQFRYTVRPEDKYPATVIRIKEILEGASPEEAIMPHVTPDSKFNLMKNIARMLRKIPFEAWEWVLVPKGQFTDPSLIVGVEKRDGIEVQLTKGEVRLRAVLSADKYFQRVLRAQVGGGAQGGPRLLRIHTLNYKEA